MEFSRNILWEFCLDVRLKCQFQFIKSLSKFYSWATWNCQDFIVFALSKHTRSNQVEVFCKKDVKYFAKLTWKDSFFIKSGGASKKTKKSFSKNTGSSFIANIHSSSEKREASYTSDFWILKSHLGMNFWINILH